MVSSCLPIRVYLFSNGSTIKTPAGDALYYSDSNYSHFISDLKISNISFNAENIEFQFPNGGIGLRDVNISEGPGKLIGIMGASGAGKTTLTQCTCRYRTTLQRSNIDQWI